ncbi:MAG: type II toxin-antitoxin system HigB family toxin [Betaproteobacteria bacterium]|nr:type II toxin-antitoxin system HigB family toxin [Betaproteobacteria bacterium]
MHIISLKALRTFWGKHTKAESPMRYWHTLVEQTIFEDFNHVKKVFGSADYVAPYTIFDVGGNSFRLITVIHYNARKVFIRLVLTHSEYDKWSKKYISGKV